MLQYFTLSEFSCPCNRDECDAAPMDAMLLLKVDGLRREMGAPMTINSGTRCRVRNEQVGGKKDSFHLKGQAVDVHCPDGLFMLRLVSLAIRHGFTGVGIKKRMVHLDTRPGTPVMFGY